MKGVTGSRYFDDYVFLISIHTPVKGVTLRMTISSNLFRYFNPHTREGCDRMRLFLHLILVDFNPHTREGCDVPMIISSPSGSNFNPHTREGCDKDLVSHMVFNRIFQSTHP